MTNGAPSCGTCHFARRQNGNYVECHFNPPSSSPVMQTAWKNWGVATEAVWPLVQVSDWCGQYLVGP